MPCDAESGSRPAAFLGGCTRRNVAERAERFVEERVRLTIRQSVDERGRQLSLEGLRTKIQIPPSLAQRDRPAHGAYG